MVAQPHYLLFCDTHLNDADASARAMPRGPGSGRWHFVLERLDGPERLEAADSEFAVNRERLALLSVVRGLEALEQPSQVTLVTTSRYVSRGLRYGLNSWRDTNYHWERFGEQRPIRNADLWRRVDTALHFHGIKCRLIEPATTVKQLAHAGTAATVGSPSETLQTLPQPQPFAAASTEPVTHETATLAAARQAPQELLGPLSTLNRLSGGQNRSPRNSACSKSSYTAQSVPGFDAYALLDWWGLALAWIKWWRGRRLTRPVYYGPLLRT